jgi:hypothetical protein
MAMIPELPEVPVTLRAEEVLGGPRPPEVGRISFGFLGPERITRQTPGVGRQAAAWLAQAGRDYAFYLLTFACSFRPGPRRLSSARLTVSLTGTAASPPIAWSMRPEERSKDITVKRSRAYDFSPELKLIGVSVKVGGVSGSAEYAADENYLIATGLFESMPEWYFQPVEGADLRGKEELQLIVRCAAGDTMRGEVFLGAKVGGIGMKADLPADYKVFTTAG